MVKFLINLGWTVRKVIVGILIAILVPCTWFLAIELPYMMEEGLWGMIPIFMLDFLLQNAILSIVVFLYYFLVVTTFMVVKSIIRKFLVSKVNE